MNTATPAHSVIPGSTVIWSRSADTRIQSSVRPTMIVHTGPMVLDVETLGLPPPQAALDGLGHRDAPAAP